MAGRPSCRGVATALAVALAACALAPAAALSAQAACPTGLTQEQCKICALSSAPAKCQACVKSAKPSSAQGAAPALAAACMVCGSLASADQQSLCTNCIKTYGIDQGCSGCVGSALFELAEGAKPTKDGLKTAGSCFACYSKAGKDIQATPACAACYAPGSDNPSACASCVAGATGVPAAARPGCFGCYQESTVDAASCFACLKGAGTPANAAVCPLCSKPGAAAAEQKQCYSCMQSVKSSLPGVRWLCHFTGTAEGNKPTAALTAAAPRYQKCLAAAATLEAGQGCRKCMDAIEKGGAAAGSQCFAALGA